MSVIRFIHRLGKLTLQKHINQISTVGSTVIKSSNIVQRDYSRQFSSMEYVGLLCRRGNVMFQQNGCGCLILLKRMKTKKAKKAQKATSSSSLKLDTSLAEGVIDLHEMKREMKACVEKLQKDFKQKYAAKLTSGLLDTLRVQIDGENTPLYEVAQVTSDGKEFTITPMMEGVNNIQKQLMTSIHATGLDLNPKLDGSTIKIPISLASSEYKENLLKLSKAAAEKSKVALRKVRQQGMTDLRKTKDSVSKDNLRLIEKQIQQLTDAHAQEVDHILAVKESELKS